jgi:hypothetical protein
VNVRVQLAAALLGGTGEVVAGKMQLRVNLSIGEEPVPGGLHEGTSPRSSGATIELEHTASEVASTELR